MIVQSAAVAFASVVIMTLLCAWARLAARVLPLRSSWSLGEQIASWECRAIQ